MYTLWLVKWNLNKEDNKLQNNNKKIPVIINCDTGIDDAVALMIAVKSEKLDIKLITTDIGNVNTTQSAINTLNVLELINAPSIPVVVGDGKCYKKERTRVSVHGSDGLGGYKFKDHSRKITEGDAVEEIYKTLMASDEKITILTISPISNIAKLISRHPECLDKIEKFVIMVGTIEETPEGENHIQNLTVQVTQRRAKKCLTQKFLLKLFLWKWVTMLILLGKKCLKQKIQTLWEKLLSLYIEAIEIDM